MIIAPVDSTLILGQNIDAMQLEAGRNLRTTIFPLLITSLAYYRPLFSSIQFKLDNVPFAPLKPPATPIMVRGGFNVLAYLLHHHFGRHLKHDCR